ncbi:ROK family transcriptional regulator [Kocuria tytonis]|uniref:ROK family transcriptional regulator n=1 Tax=Kocuria tytonis TaxID=2054280 RepID=A0A495A9F8_9MICC|nr:ROK family transcriptional regulator [Kocuria tytonis]RKQ35167.1 ROK family transcriptional regulator [Kocuria tytonis]
MTSSPPAPDSDLQSPSGGGHLPDTAAPGSQAALRRANRRRVVDTVRSQGAVTQARIARETALAPSTVSSIVKELTACDLLAVEPDHGGRRGQRVRFSASAGYLVGVDVGHRHVEVALADLNLEIRARRRSELPAGHRAQDVLAEVRETCSDLRASLGIAPDRVLHAGLTLPAPVDAQRRALDSDAILPRWAGTDVRALAARLLDCPVVVENDANAGAVSEHALGAGRGVADMAYLKVAHGVGAGLILGGRLYRGASGSAGEIGHITLDEGAGLCRCGNRGCLETFVCAPAVLDLVRTSGQHAGTVADVVATALQGDPGCRRVVADTGRVLGSAVAQLCNLLNPELVVLGGELGQAGDLVLDPMMEAVDRYSLHGDTRLRIVPSELGAGAHLMGALILARSESSLPV